MLSSRPGAIYQQDNARPHTARLSQQCLQGYDVLPWPARSPDLSPIDHMNTLDILLKCVKWKGHIDKSRIQGDSILAANVYALDECVRYEVESSGYHVFVLVPLPSEQWKDECYVAC
ncbi:HTH_Tnp_Tc3_2 domain-containing protein [Trichonephila clavipes]|nr:HTH_Tnp_Tc3_2 domain-containing protein [Trichonephila clavipes]